MNLAPLMARAEDNPTLNQDGVPDDAIHIQTAAQLSTIGGLGSAGKYFVLDNDIDLVSEFVPINDFRGTFNGQGHSINNFYILANSSRTYAGLFGQISVDGVTIKNVGVNINSNGVSASVYAGGLIGYSSSVVVENSYATGDIIASSTNVQVYVGGLIGYSTRVDVENSYATGDITVTSTSGSASAYVGGLIGYNTNSLMFNRVVVENSYATGDIIATTIANYNFLDVIASVYVGGLIGYSTSSLIVENSYATGDITATATTTSGSVYGSSASVYAGGLIGYSTMSGTIGGSYRTSVVVENSYATGDITATPTSTYASFAAYAHVGGLIGYSNSDVSVTVANSYATGDITATPTSTYGFAASVYVGRLIGSCGGITVENSYATGNVTATTSASGSGPAYAGGLIGYIGSTMSGVTIDSSYATGDITASAAGSGSAIAGGLIGYSGSSSLSVENSYATGNVTATASGSGSAYAGGLIGSGSVTIKNSYARGDVTAITGSSASSSAFAGGLIGNIGVIVENSYATGDVIAVARVGYAYAGDLSGLFSTGSGAHVTSCYRLSGQTVIGDPVNYVSTSLTSEKMQNQQSFVGWDFETIWAINPNINDGYPYLRGTPSNETPANTLASIQVATLPGKTQYSVNEVLDLTGIAVIATYSNGNAKSIAGYTTTPAVGAILSTIGEQTVTVSYTEDGVTRTTSFLVSVKTAEPKPIVLESITITTMPTKTAYTQSDTLSLSGLIATAKYSDGTTKPVTSYTTAPAAGAILNTIGTQTVTVSYTENEITRTTSFSVSVKTAEPKPIVLENIVITTMPTKTAYTQSDTLSLSGLIVTAKYSDDTTHTVEGYTTTPAVGAILSTVGEQTVAVSYTENEITRTTSFLVSVKAVEPKPIVLESITITTMPTKIAYTQSDTLGLSGLVVSAKYSDGTTHAVEGYTTVPAVGAILSTVGEQIVTVSYAEAGVTRSVSFSVSVKAVEPKPIVLENIVITTMPTKIAYTQSDTLSLSGLVVTAKYSDGSAKPVTSYTTDPANGTVLNAVGTTTVSVRYTENGVTKTATVAITVNEPQVVLVSLEITTLPTKTAYRTGATLDLSGIVVIAHYSDGSAKPVTSYTTNPANGETLSLSGIQSVTVSYTEDTVSMTDSFEVEVTPFVVPVYVWVGLAAFLSCFVALCVVYAVKSKAK
jgi:hypothetical protein